MIACARTVTTSIITDRRPAFPGAGPDILELSSSEDSLRRIASARGSIIFPMDTAMQFQMYHLNSVQLPRQMTSPTVSSKAANHGAEREPSVGVARPKRQKIAQACEPCRSRKVKCDGIHPGKPILSPLALFAQITCCTA